MHEMLSSMNVSRTTSVVRSSVGPTKIMAVQTQCAAPIKAATRGARRKNELLATSTGAARTIAPKSSERTVRVTAASSSHKSRRRGEMASSWRTAPYFDLPDGTRRQQTKAEVDGEVQIPKEARVFRANPITNQRTPQGDDLRAYILDGKR